jgi:hypothetical protein
VWERGLGSGMSAGVKLWFTNTHHSTFTHSILRMPHLLSPHPPSTTQKRKLCVYVPPFAAHTSSPWPAAWQHTVLWAPSGADAYCLKVEERHAASWEAGEVNQGMHPSCVLLPQALFGCCLSASPLRSKLIAGAGASALVQDCHLAATAFVGSGSVPHENPAMHCATGGGVLGRWLPS